MQVHFSILFNSIVRDVKDDKLTSLTEFDFYKNFSKQLIENSLNWIQQNKVLKEVSKEECLFAFILLKYFNSSNYQLTNLNKLAEEFCKYFPSEFVKKLLVAKEPEFKSFIENVKKLYPEKKFEEIFKQFECEVLDNNELEFNTLCKIVSNVRYDKTQKKFYSPSMSFSFTIEQISAQISKLNRDVKSDVKFGSVIYDKEMPLMIFKRTKKRRFSIISFRKDKVIGKGEFGEVFSFYSITQNIRIAGKLPLKSNSKYIEIITREVQNLEAFSKIPNLSGLTFLPIQKLLHTFKDERNAICFTSVQYKTDLYTWIGGKPEPKEKIIVIYQIIYTAYLYSKIDYIDLDLKLENIFLFKFKKEPRIAFGDLCGHFWNNIRNNYVTTYFNTNEAAIIPEDNVKLKSVMDNALKTKQYMEKIMIYQFGSIIFSIIAEIKLHANIEDESDLMPCIPTSENLLEQDEFIAFNNALKDLKFSEKTLSSLMALVFAMINPDLEKRKSAEDIFKDMQKIIVCDLQLNAIFKELKYI